MAQWPHIPSGWISRAAIDGGDDRRAVFARRRAGPFLVSLCAYRSDFRQPAHEHDFAIVDLNLSGGGRGTCGRTEYLSRAGEVEFYPAGVGHSFTAGERGIRTMHVSLQRDPSVPHARGTEPTRHDQATLLRHALHTLRALQEPKDWDELSVESACWELFAPPPGPIRTNRRAPTWLAQVLDVLHAHADRPVGLGELAGIAGVHRGALARTFRSSTGRTVGDYHRRLRAAHAARRLAAGDPPTTASLEAGFADQAHLGRWFKREIGVTPGQFARLTRG